MATDQRARQNLSCPSGKARYRTQTSAENTLRRMTREKGWIGRALSGHWERRAYACPHCRGWHLTSQPLESHEHGS